MKIKPIIIVPGAAESVFFEIFIKSLNIINTKSPIILICSLDLFKISSKRFNLKKKIRLISEQVNEFKLSNKLINIIDVNYKMNKNKFTQIKNGNDYVLKSFNIAFNLLEKKITNKFLNGPINKKKFLNKKYLGITEYISNYFNKKKIGMLIYNNNLSVCPVTTHLPLKLVQKNISKKLIQDKIKIINNFYIKIFKFKPKIGVAGLNPHCESILKYNEDDKIILPAIKFAKKIGFSVFGPYPSDTIFLKQNRKKFDVILGMYHDQVLGPFKALFEYNAINITMGLPFLRVSPDHGPNEKMINKNLSNPASLIKALKFLDKN
jgi:4-hydroxy-L-threonine phosphate dehydrogenase PdxA